MVSNNDFFLKRYAGGRRWGDYFKTVEKTGRVSNVKVALIFSVKIWCSWSVGFCTLYFSQKCPLLSKFEVILFTTGKYFSGKNRAFIKC
jgi:hypothetical protein